jgi:hypothetical protein
VGSHISLLVTVKAYPNIGQRHGEVVCVAGTLDGLPPVALRTFSAGLDMADGHPVRWFALPIRYRASDCEGGEADPQPLAMIAMRSALRKAANERSLLSTLANAQQPFWNAVGDAVTAVAADPLPAM